MRLLAVVMILGLMACADTTTRQTVPTASESLKNALSSSGATTLSLGSSNGPFTGTWLLCEAAAPLEECSRYDLVQRGARICGTWSYVASNRPYEGRVVAQATSEFLAQRTHVCGRPGSETDTECELGWQTISKPLEICNGRLSDTSSVGACHADFSQGSRVRAGFEELEASAWMQECLRSTP